MASPEGLRNMDTANFGVLSAHLSIPHVELRVTGQSDFLHFTLCFIIQQIVLILSIAFKQ